MARNVSSGLITFLSLGGCSDRTGDSLDPDEEHARHGGRGSCGRALSSSRQFVCQCEPHGRYPSGIRDRSDGTGNAQPNAREGFRRGPPNTIAGGGHRTGPHCCGTRDADRRDQSGPGILGDRCCKEQGWSTPGIHVTNGARRHKPRRSRGTERRRTTMAWISPGVSWCTHLGHDGSRRDTPAAVADRRRSQSRGEPHGPHRISGDTHGQSPRAAGSGRRGMDAVPHSSGSSALLGASAGHHGTPVCCMERSSLGRALAATCTSASRGRGSDRRNWDVELRGAPGAGSTDRGKWRRPSSRRGDYHWAHQVGRGRRGACNAAEGAHQ